MPQFLQSFLLALAIACGFAPTLLAAPPGEIRNKTDSPTLNQKADGYHGVWSMDQPTNDEYKYKYSGAEATYSTHHSPFAVYRPEVRKTFFCYGGAPAGDSRKLLHMVSYYDHASGTVPRPTILLDKHTGDAHDNPVIAVDAQGYVWIFSTAHGLARRAYINRSKRPYDIDEFERVDATRKEGDEHVPIDNYSYMQVWNVPERGFIAFFTRYHYPAIRTTLLMRSDDGVQWGKWHRLGAIQEGHYQVAAVAKDKIASAMNYHPKKLGLNYRTNLYYIESPDEGDNWRAADGRPVRVPLQTIANPALVHDYKSEGLNVYVIDLQFDAEGQPVILYVTSKGFESGPKNDPRTWRIAKWHHDEWRFVDITTSDSNYDMGSLYIEDLLNWRIIAPTEQGPQAYNPGGEMAMWVSHNGGGTWEKEKQLTAHSKGNHNYARRPLGAQPDFYCLWAEANARAPSESSLLFCNQAGDVYRLPTKMDSATAKPELVPVEP